MTNEKPFLSCSCGGCARTALPYSDFCSTCDRLGCDGGPCKRAAAEDPPGPAPSFEFDCVDGDWAVRLVGEVATIERDADAKVSVKLFGPGGGNPCVTVEGLSRESARLFSERLAAERMSWIDETGEIHDYA